MTVTLDRSQAQPGQEVTLFLSPFHPDVMVYFGGRPLPKKVQGSSERPRVAVFKSLRYIYAQIVDDVAGRTLVQASSFEPEIRKRLEAGTLSKEAARVVGEALARQTNRDRVGRVVVDVAEGWSS